MGGQEVTPATKKEIEEHFKHECFQISGSWDIEKLKESISDLPKYVGGQISLIEEWTKKKTPVSKIEEDRSTYRKGLPDTKRRDVFLSYFNLTPDKCKITFNAVYEDTNKEEIEIAQEDQPSMPFLHTHFLNTKGIQNLELIVHLINKEKMIEYAPILINSISLLLIYWTVEETYWIAQKMMERSSKLLSDPKTKKLMRWYFSFSKQDYFKLIGAFIMSYIDTTKFKKRSILIRLQKIGYDINELLDEMFKYFFTSFLRVDYVMDIFTFFYFEGIKIVFRFAYASMKVHKDIIKAVEKPEKVKDCFKKAAYDNTDWSYLHERAFKYRVSRSHYDINKTDKVELTNEREEYKIVSDFLPSDCNWPSEILSLKQFYRLWMMLPEYCQVRVPQLLYSTAKDGYLLSSLYKNWKPYEEKVSVKFMFLIIKTTDGDIFGAFLDTVIVQSVKTYIGSDESFIFGFYPDKRIVHYSEKKNNQYCIGGVDYLQIGGGGDGPAIYLNNSMQEGQTNKCETFGNGILTSTGNTFFEVACIEAIMI